MSGLTEKELIDRLNTMLIRTYVGDDEEFLEEIMEAYIQLVKIVEGHFSMEEDVAILRKFMWVNHGCSPHALYGDDGEMQCGNCLLDFKRMPIKELNKSIVKERIKRMRANQEQSTEPVQVDEDTKNVIDNLVGLQECLEAGEDWCSVAIIAGAIELLTQKRTVTREWVNKATERLQAPEKKYMGEVLVDLLQGLCIEVEK